MLEKTPVKPLDHCILSGKCILLGIWLIPLIWYLQSILTSVPQLSFSLLHDTGVMLVALLLAIVPAAATALSLSSAPPALSALLFLPWVCAMIIPEHTIRLLTAGINDNTFWYAVLEQWLKLFPTAVLPMLIAIKRIDEGLFNLARLSTLPVYLLVYKYFLPLLSPVVLLALLLAISPTFLYAQPQTNAQIMQLIFSLPLLILAHRLAVQPRSS